MALLPRDRIKLIREIVAALKNNEWSDIDLVLSQHGFPTTETWQGTNVEYVTAMIERGDDSDLQELHSFLYSDSDRPASDLSTAAKQHGIWKPRFFEGDRFFQLFVSHTHHHKGEVAALKSALIPYGVSAFVAHQDIRPTDEWADIIMLGLQTCDGLLAYLTDEFPSSSWTDQEVGVAVGRGRLVIPVKVSINPYGLIGRYQAVERGARPPDQLAADIVDILRGHDATKQLMAEVAVDRFCFSYSYNNARDNLKLIESVPRVLWTPSMVERVRRAVADNHELSADVGFGRSTVGAEALRIVGAL